MEEGRHEVDAEGLAEVVMIAEEAMTAVDTLLEGGTAEGIEGGREDMRRTR